MQILNGYLWPKADIGLIGWWRVANDPKRSLDQMARMLKFLGISIVLAVQTASAEVSQVWESAASEVIRVDPGSFESLSTEIIEYLSELGCTIPQTPHPSQLHNVVQGHFDDSGIVDVALLCSIEQRSAILVFWDGSASNADQVSSWSDDKDWLQTGTEGIEFSRTLSVASPELIIRYSTSYQSDLTVDPRHDGLDEGFQGKASTVHYWDGENWHKLQGAD